VKGPVAVTGASGFFGRHLMGALLRRGIAARALVRDPGKWQQACSRLGTAARATETAVADLTDKASLCRALAGAEALIHNAALADPKRSGWQENFLPNVVGTRNLLACMAEAGVRRLLLISTIGVYRLRPGQILGRRSVMVTDPVHRPRIGPDGAARPRRPAYGVTKAMSEALCREAAETSGLALTILRTSATYGVDDPNIEPVMRRLMAKRLAPLPKLVFPLVYAEDAAAAVIEALIREASIGKTYNLPGPADLSLVDFVRGWREAMGGRVKLLVIPTPVRIGFDMESACADLGFINRPLPAALDAIQALAAGKRSLADGT